MFKKLFILLFICSVVENIHAQEIEFGKFKNYSLSPTVKESFEFGFVFSDEGTKTINLGDDGMAVLSIKGIKFLDVIVNITKPAALIHTDPDISDEIPLTNLEAAYANEGANDISQAVMFNNLQARFPVSSRENAPPGPPPTPPHEGFNAPQSTAYIYLWGSIDVGNVASGKYTAIIDVTIEYF